MVRVESGGHGTEVRAGCGMHGVYRGLFDMSSVSRVLPWQSSRQGRHRDPRRSRDHAREARGSGYVDGRPFRLPPRPPACWSTLIRSGFSSVWQKPLPLVAAPHRVAAPQGKDSHVSRTKASITATRRSFFGWSQAALAAAFAGFPRIASAVSSAEANSADPNE